MSTPGSDEAFRQASSCFPTFPASTGTLWKQPRSLLPIRNLSNLFPNLPLLQNRSATAIIAFCTAQHHLVPSSASIHLLSLGGPSCRSHTIAPCSCREQRAVPRCYTSTRRWLKGDVKTLQGRQGVKSGNIRWEKSKPWYETATRHNGFPIFRKGRRIPASPGNASWSPDERSRVSTK